MKLIIQIPCLNEAASLPITLGALPRTIEGMDEVEWLVVNDGSSDDTETIAKAHGVDHVITHSKQSGLARAFMSGINACLDLGADIIVNTDADNQYRSEYITELIKPILEKKAEIVIGARELTDIRSFTATKRLLSSFGSWAVRMASGTDIPDAPSGFRAFSRKAAKKMNVFNPYTHTLETIILAGQENIPITWIPVKTNASLRPSRLIKNIPSYIAKSIVTMIRIFALYRPFRFFMTIGLILFLSGVVIGVRFLVFYLMGDGGGHVQSLILSSILVGIGFQTMIVSFVVDILSVNRRLLEELLYRSRKKTG